MGYAVGHRDAAGVQRIEDVASLEAAVELVERLRNEQGPADVRVFREVPIEVRTYYKVVVADEAEGAGVPAATSGAAAPTSASPASASPASATVTSAPDDRIPPGTFPLGGPTPTPVFESAEPSVPPPGEGHRRANRFGRGG